MDFWRTTAASAAGLSLGVALAVAAPGTALAENSVSPVSFSEGGGNGSKGDDKGENGYDEDDDKDENGHDEDENGHDEDKNGHDKDENGHDDDGDMPAGGVDTGGGAMAGGQSTGVLTAAGAALLAAVGVAVGRWRAGGASAARR